MNFKTLNNYIGWAIFAVAITVYSLTIEPTVSFWDCGEYIATSNKLEVGHPPGAPLFMMSGRLISSFVGPENAAVAVNFLSALSSAFTILFLFWTISAIGRLMALRTAKVNGDENPSESGFDTAQLIAILGSAAVGALAFTFSDSFWFSAVEGEVYAMSSMFTAVTFWAILRWERVADEPHSDRWLVLIAYLVGLSIGVHLLNLLCIPAIAYVYYYKKFDHTPTGWILTGVISVVGLGIIMNVIIPGLVSLASGFELFFVNKFGLPFNSGAIIYALILITIIVFGLRFAHRAGKPMLATGLLCLTTIIIGYSSFGMILVRSNANTPMDQNNPEDTIRLLAYLNREQYGTWPLLYGQYFNTPLDAEEPYVDGSPVYFKDEVNGKYSVADDRKASVPNYDRDFCGFFPRMWRAEKQRKDGYRAWTDFKGQKKQRMRDNGTPLLDAKGLPVFINKPTVGENLSFFFGYQIDWMYIRYFMWNFAGRQNDTQGHGNKLHGNWLSGISFIDEQRLGPQDNIPKALENKANNKFYLIPLILGLIGMVYHFVRDTRYAFITLMLFLFTGLAIVVYLNQGAYEPRERDYAYAGSFYAFAIWIGLGVYALFDFAVNGKWQEYVMPAGIAGGTAVFILLVQWLAGTDFGFGFTLLYIVVIGGGLFALMRALGDSMKGNRTAIAGIALAIGMSAPILMGVQGWDDHDRSNRYTARAMAINYLGSCDQNAILFSMGDNDTFPLWYMQEVEGYRTDVRVVNLSYLGIDWYIDQMQRRAYKSAPLPLSLKPEQYRQGTRDFIYIDNSQNTNEVAVDAAKLMAFIRDDGNKVGLQGGNFVNYIPTRHFKIPVDREKVVANGTVTPDKKNQVVSELTWSVGEEKRILSKSEMVILDILAHNNWERPIYFTTTIGRSGYFNLTKYFQVDGFCYRLVPIANNSQEGQLLGSVNTKVLGPNLMEKFEWGNIDTDRSIYLDHTNTRLLGNIRMYFLQLAEAYLKEGKTQEAINVVDHCIEKLPGDVIAYNYIANRFAELYFNTGETEKGATLAAELFTQHYETLNYYLRFENDKLKTIENELRMEYSILGNLHDRLQSKMPEDLKVQWTEQYNAVSDLYIAKMMAMNPNPQAMPR